MQYVNVSGVVVAPSKWKCNSCLQRLVVQFECHISIYFNVSGVAYCPQNGSVTFVLSVIRQCFRRCRSAPKMEVCKVHSRDLYLGRHTS